MIMINQSQLEITVMVETPLISIVTIVFNGDKYLEETILSVINQSYKNIEYIIIDGGSTDRTLDIIKKYEKSIDYWISEKDNGMYDALAKGFSFCHGEFIAFINSDDFYFPNAFSTVIDIFSMYKDVKWLTGMPVGYNNNGEITGVQYPWGYKSIDISQGLYGGRNRLDFIQQESTFWRKEMLSYIDMNKFKSAKLAGDYYLWKKFSEYENLYSVQSCFAGFRTHQTQLSSDINSYVREFDELSDPLPTFWKGKVFLLKILKLLPDKIKQKYSPNLLFFDYEKDSWVMHK